MQTYREMKELLPLLNKVQIVYNKTTQIPLPRPNRQSNNTKQRIGGMNGQTIQQAGPYLLFTHMTTPNQGIVLTFLGERNGLLSLD